MTDKLRQAAQQAVAILGPEAPLCSGCVEEWAEALRILNDALAEHYCDTHCTWLDHAAGCDKAEQPAEQEPVGEVSEVAQGYDEGWTAIIETGVHKLQKGGKVYTSPQPAKQPLTDKEIGQVRWQCRWNRMSTDDNLVSATTQQLDAFARAVITAYEAKNGIGGGV